MRKRPETVSARWCDSRLPEVRSGSISAAHAASAGHGFAGVRAGADVRQLPRTDRRGVGPSRSFGPESDCRIGTEPGHAPGACWKSVNARFWKRTSRGPCRRKRAKPFTMRPRTCGCRRDLEKTFRRAINQEQPYLLECTLVSSRRRQRRTSTRLAACQPANERQAQHRRT